MRSLGIRNTFVRLTAILCLAAVGLFLAFPAVCAEERPARPPRLSPEELEKVWRAEAIGVAVAFEVGRENGAKLVKAYVSAREKYAEKVGSLPRTAESRQQRRELGEKASADLKKALVEAVGADKAEKIIGLLNPFGMMGSRLDRMVNDLLALELPNEKLLKAYLAVLEYNRDLGKLVSEARKPGASREGLREKMEALTEGLNKELAKFLSEEQMATWKEKYQRGGFGGRRQRQQ